MHSTGVRDRTFGVLAWAWANIPFEPNHYPEIPLLLLAILFAGSKGLKERTDWGELPVFHLSAFYRGCLSAEESWGGKVPGPQGERGKVGGREEVKD